MDPHPGPRAEIPILTSFGASLGDSSKERMAGIIWDVLEVQTGQESAAKGHWRCQKPGEFGTGLVDGTSGGRGGGPVDTPELFMDALWHLDHFPK